MHREQDERDESDAGHPIRLEPVRARTHRVPGVIARAVRDDAGIARVILLDLEHDLHQVGADVRNLREDAAGHAQRRGTQRFTDREADKAGSRVVSRNEQQDAEHHHQLDTDEQHADAHPGPQRNRVAGIGFAAETRKGRAGVRKGVDANPEPGDAVAPPHADEAEQQDDDHLERGISVRHGAARRDVFRQHAEVDGDDRADEQPEEEQESALPEEIRLAGFVDQLGDLPHGAMHREIAQLHVTGDAEHKSERANDEAPEEQAASSHSEEGRRVQIRQDQRGLTAGGMGLCWCGALGALGDPENGEQRRQARHAQLSPEYLLVWWEEAPYFSAYS